MVAGVGDVVADSRYILEGGGFNGKCGFAVLLSVDDAPDVYVRRTGALSLRRASGDSRCGSACREPHENGDKHHRVWEVYTAQVSVV